VTGHHGVFVVPRVAVERARVLDIVRIPVQWMAEEIATVHRRILKNVDSLFVLVSLTSVVWYKLV